MKERSRVVAVVLLALGLALVSTVDIDGNPLTQDFPSVVLVDSAVESATCSEGVFDDAEQDRLHGRMAQVLMLHRVRRRWVTIVRRWHRSFLTDTPV